MTYKKSEYFRMLYLSERQHYYIFSKLAENEKNKEIKAILSNLALQEELHSRMWGSLIEGKFRNTKSGADATANLLLGLKSILGIELTVKTMEYNETAQKRKLDLEGKSMPFTKKEKDTIKKIESLERENEDPLKQKLLSYNAVLNNIRSVIFGMNDGLVEILGAVAGFAAALQQPLLIIAAGLIVAISGTLSMAGGAYLSIEYEQSVRKKGSESSKSAAFYTGLAYILGSLVPLLPFLFGLSGWSAIGISIVLTAIVLSVVSIIISIISDTSIRQRIFRTLLISLGIVAITVTLGVLARGFLHINV
jgi:vacuolar iron transporter family protein